MPFFLPTTAILYLRGPLVFLSFFCVLFQWRAWVCESRILRIPHENIFGLNSGVFPSLFHLRFRLFLSFSFDFWYQRVLLFY